MTMFLKAESDYLINAISFHRQWGTKKLLT